MLVEKKRGEWAQGAIPVVNGEGAEVLYFVDSITSYDERMQSIGRATVGEPTTIKNKPPSDAATDQPDRT